MTLITYERELLLRLPMTLHPKYPSLSHNPNVGQNLQSQTSFHYLPTEARPNKLFAMLQCNSRQCLSSISLAFFPTRYV